MSNAQPEHVTHDKENSNPDAASSRKRERAKDAACDENRREEKRKAAGKLADQNSALQRANAGQQVCVAFCLPCGTGTGLALAALVCVS